MPQVWAAFAVLARWCALPLILLASLLLLKLYDWEAGARELYPGQYDNVAPSVRQWFRSQKSPKTGGLCCSEADGIYAEEDLRQGHYWTRFQFIGVAGDSEQSGWMQVPDEVVIHDPNRQGAPVVWYFFQNGAVAIRCYAPGGGV